MGVPEDDAEAVKWYRKAAEQGFAKSQHNLGVMYDKGTRVPQNHAALVKWYRTPKFLEMIENREVSLVRCLCPFCTSTLSSRSHSDVAGVF